MTAKIENRNGPTGAQEHKQHRRTSELTSRFENIEIYKTDYSLACKLEQEAQLLLGWPAILPQSKN